VTIPSLAGCHTQARTIEQGRERIREALAAWLDDDAVAKKAKIVEDVRLPRAVPKEVGSSLKKARALEADVRERTERLQRERAGLRRFRVTRRGRASHRARREVAWQRRDAHHWHMPSERLAKVLKLAEELPEEERVELARELVRHLPDEALAELEIEYDELDRRMESVRDGSATLVPWEEARKELLADK
jgi:hypothetical protein